MLSIFSNYIRSFADEVGVVAIIPAIYLFSVLIEMFR